MCFIKTNDFLKGDNIKNRALNESFSVHLKYSYYFNNKTINKIYPGVYQGIGAAFFTFGDRAELGNPLSLYIYQGARLFNITNYLSFNYEWNLGLSFGWKNYNQFYNEYNKIIGSKVNAYINVNTYFLSAV